MKISRVSIVIPVLNEEDYLPATILSLKALDPAAYEILAVDGGSTDNSCSLLKNYGINTYFSNQSSRAIQMNIGAAKATGDLLVFLHADTRVPANLISLVAGYMENEGLVLGGFVSMMSGAKNWPGISRMNYIKTWLWSFFLKPGRFFFHGLRILFGDQVMFCRKCDFDLIHGFNENYKILEDAELCVRINRLGRIRQFPEKVYSSDRRVERQGFLKAMWVYLFITFLWTIGFSSEKLAKYYKNIR